VAHAGTAFAGVAWKLEWEAVSWALFSSIEKSFFACSSSLGETKSPLGLEQPGSRRTSIIFWHRIGNMSLTTRDSPILSDGRRAMLFSLNHLAFNSVNVPLWFHLKCCWVLVLNSSSSVSPFSLLRFALLFWESLFHNIVSATSWLKLSNFFLHPPV